MDVRKCVIHVEDVRECQPMHDDFFECLHNTKEVSFWKKKKINYFKEKMVEKNRFENYRKKRSIP